MKPNTRKAAKPGQIAVCEVHDVRTLVDEHNADRAHRIEASTDHACPNQANEVDHALKSLTNRRRLGAGPMMLVDHFNDGRESSARPIRWSTVAV